MRSSNKPSKRLRVWFPSQIAQSTSLTQTCSPVSPLSDLTKTTSTSTLSLSTTKTADRSQSLKMEQLQPFKSSTMSNMAWKIRFILLTQSFSEMKKSCLSFNVSLELSRDKTSTLDSIKLTNKSSKFCALIWPCRLRKSRPSRMWIRRNKLWLTRYSWPQKCARSAVLEVCSRRSVSLCRDISDLKLLEL